MRWPWSVVALTAALALVQADLWFGRDNMPQVIALRKQLAVQHDANAAARARNERAAAELADLQEGLEMVEEKARAELGMVKPDEILVLYARGPAASASASAPARTRP